MSNQQQPPYGTIRAVVGKVLDSYIVAYAVQNYGDLGKNDPITVSLGDWKGHREPHHLQVVELDDVALYSNGWRALSATPIVPRRQTSKQQQAVRSSS